ncbi:hypothetical protein PTKIN_Ptkin08bG0056800 [Pterospermum kingtungense]
MSTSQGSETSQLHIALFPGAGMGHLTPFLRLASMLLSHNCVLTLITTKSTVSVTESNHISFFLSKHPEMKHIEFQVPPMQPSNTTTNDPFAIRYEATSCSAHLIHSLIASLSPPLSAIFSDFLVASGVNKVALDIGIPNYIVSTTSLKFLSLIAYLPILISDAAKLTDLTEIEIPGLTPLPISSIPPPFFNPNHIFTATLVSNARALPYCRGILTNSFDFFEPETVSAINSKRALSSLLPILPIGPLETYEVKKDQGRYLPWLNSQPQESVVLVSFGSRTTLSKDQIKELRDGLEKSEYRFLWVLKTKIVDKDDKQDLEDLLSCSFLERTKNKGMVLKEWVNQQDILAHPAIGGFVNHCGWNSVMEAAQRGIPVLAWPQGGDQRVNAEVLEKAGLGIWDRTWGWAGQRLVKQDEIQTKIRGLMTDEKLRSSAKKVAEEARKATGNCGNTSIQTIIDTIESMNQNKSS